MSMDSLVDDIELPFLCTNRAVVVEVLCVEAILFPWQGIDFSHAQNDLAKSWCLCCVNWRMVNLYRTGLMIYTLSNLHHVHVIRMA